MNTHVRAILTKPLVAGPRMSVVVRGEVLSRRLLVWWVIISLLAGVDVFLATYFERGDVLAARTAVAAPPVLVAAAMPDEVSPGDPVEPVPFEFGGQTATFDHTAEMHDMGMTWAKFQIKWAPGARGSDVATRIEEAHDRGFKVLLSITGPAFPDAIDYAAYEQYLAEAATHDPDAIEVWNEQNLAREWPVGQISGENYVENMLKPAYTTIKAINPDVMVISGALSPTGYFGGCKPEGCDDATFIEGMMAARGYYYMDCVGVHFNSGATSPLATSGHPADGGDGHYTWYYQPTVDVYDFLGIRPLCFTELGYVSPEGYGEIAGNFGWASDTNVEEQAEWLAETVSLAQESGRVRLIVVFNVDLEYYGPNDPQAGYAIVRPGGSCPACEALTEALSF